MKKLIIAKGIELPLDIVTQTIAILAKRRAGKSYTMRRLVEQLFKAEQQLILVDPKGDQWGVRSSADGKKPGLPIVILGGEHGDAPLEVNAGEVVAKLVVEERVSVLLDLSTFRKHEVATFMTAFLENLYRLKAQEQYRTPCMLVIDEADAIAPQKPQKGEERMLGAAEDIVRRGGQRGIGCALITQRSAVLNKNVLTQAQMLVVLRTIAPQDLSAMKAWIEVHGDLEQGKTLMDSLPSLPIGDAWFWSPGWPTAEGIFTRSHVLPIETFDSGATPAPGVKKVVPKNLADVDLDALKKQMASTIEKAKNDNPKLLKTRIAELEKGLAPMGVSQWLEYGKKYGYRDYFEKKMETKMVEKPILKDSQISRLEKVFGQMIKEAERHGGAMSLLWGNFNEIGDVLVKALEVLKQKPVTTTVGYDTGNKDKSVAVTVRNKPNGLRTVMNVEEIKEIGKGELTILKAIAQFEEGITREHLTVLTGYKRSSRDTYIQRLQSRKYIEISAGVLRPTALGIEILGSDYEPLPTGAELREHHLRTLPEGERKILKILIDSFPESVDREIISEMTGYQRSSRDTYIQRLTSRQLVLSNSPGFVQASNKLFII